eukprot:gb/GECH01008705.1/.p1 GENE.gb/GECH01008705.1/~~gb/GECH01008705.1/.p1  ORF type:complete len:127 (+),score=10.83 gb/GECH01008705.1/:1-381(+)
MSKRIALNADRVKAKPFLTYVSRVKVGFDPFMREPQRSVGVREFYRQCIAPSQILANKRTTLEPLEIFEDRRPPYLRLDFVDGSYKEYKDASNIKVPQLIEYLILYQNKVAANSEDGDLFDYIEDL